MRFRLVPAVLLCACLAGLAACGDADAEAGGTRATAPSPSTTTPSTTTPSATTPSAGGATGDKALCDTVNAAAAAMKGSISDAQQANGAVAPADAKDAFTTFHRAVTEALVFAPDTDVATATRAVADEIAKAAAADDPIGTAADSGFAGLGSTLTDACKAAGATIDF
ncbi:hypothetical protein FHX34_102926 [Actinoplanes teichomyceticus]|uniref:Lipoprotein n=2 Tax=Actinoplanes teichomyceticus TaxID=1867 RepID=A0A561WKL0_ACTTI|nr:hypothetical protein FHX34_102926 [Actinoplanes teichomyceticus]GIF12778.1 hypothetical protein Ate01nite_28100 [Actinoplanes teichomyceticus]